MNKPSFQIVGKTSFLRKGLFPLLARLYIELILVRSFHLSVHGFLFQKFQQAVKVFAKSPTFARNGRQLQFEADMNRLFLYTSYNRLGKNASDADADEIIDLASKASSKEQQKLVQENIHEQINSFCTCMDEILVHDPKTDDNSPSERKNAPQRSGLGLAVGKIAPLHDNPAVLETKPLKRFELSQKVKDQIGYTLEIKPSQIPHKDAGQGLFVDGEASVGSVIAIYPGVTYSPANYPSIPGYPRVDLQNPYLITRYDGTVINGKPWGCGGETRQMWNGTSFQESDLNSKCGESYSDRALKLLSKPSDGAQMSGKGEILEIRNPFAFAHFANHPAKGISPNVMVCPYDFPLSEKNMRAYIPNIAFGNGEEVSMKKFGTFWFKTWKQGSSVSHVPVIKSLVLVATREICNEEVLLNYRLSNLKRRPEWYTPVDEEEDGRRWS